jgi:hypothetical protein
MAKKPKPTPKLTNAEPRTHFVDMANEVQASDDPKDFEKAFKSVIPPTPRKLSGEAP